MYMESTINMFNMFKPIASLVILVQSSYQNNNLIINSLFVLKDFKCKSTKSVLHIHIKI